MSGYTLIIDTSIFGAGIAFFSSASDSIEYSRVSQDISDSARELPLMVEAGLGVLGIDLTKVNRVLVSQGPGSFTGIRVGMAYAFGFVAGLKLSKRSFPKIAGVSSLASLTKGLAADTKSRLAVFLPATKTSGYVSIIKDGEVEMSALDCLKSDAADFFDKNIDVDWVVVGSWELVLERANKHGVQNVRQILGRDAVSISLRALGEAIKGKDDLTWADFESEKALSPIYLRKSTVEEKASL